jgi:hypothetical protein
MKYFAWAYHTLLALLVVGIACVLLISGGSNVQFRMLPMFSSAYALYWVLGLGLFGLLSVGLAVTGKLRALLALHSLIALVVLIWGYFLGPYNFAGPGEAQTALYLCLGALLALFGSLLDARRAKA